MLGERIAPQSEVIRAIMSGYSPYCGPSHLDTVDVGLRVRVDLQRAVMCYNVRVWMMV